MRENFARDGQQGDTSVVMTVMSRGRPNVTLIVSAETETRPKVYALHSAETIKVTFGRPLHGLFKELILGPLG